MWEVPDINLSLVVTGYRVAFPQSADIFLRTFFSKLLICVLPLDPVSQSYKTTGKMGCGLIIVTFKLCF
jgi:hypothetical protein